MKKVFALMFVAGVMALASCKKAETTTEATDAPAVDTTATVAVDSAATTDSSAVAPADSAK